MTTPESPPPMVVAAAEIDRALAAIDRGEAVVVVCDGGDALAELELEVALAGHPNVRVVRAAEVAIEDHQADEARLAARRREVSRLVSAANAQMGELVSVPDASVADAEVRAFDQRGFRQRAIQMGLVTEMARVGTWTYDVSTTTLIMSRTAMELNGLVELRDLKANDWWAALHPDDGERVLASLDEALNGGGTFEVVYRRPGHHGGWLEARGSIDEQSVSTVIHGVVMDVTDRVARLSDVSQDLDRERSRAEGLEMGLEDLRVASEELERLNSLRRTVLRAMSHDLGNRLTALMGFAETVKNYRDRLSEEQVDEYIGRVVSGAHQMARVIHNLLDLDMVEAGVELRGMELDVADELRELCAGLTQTEGWDITLGLPEGSVLATVSPTALNRIVENLVRNAAEHSPPGGIVTVRVRVEDSELIIEVADQGEGVPVADRLAIFEAHQQGSGGRGGRGVGLAVVKGFVDAHAGTVEVGAGPDGGAVFTVRLTQLAGALSPHPELEMPDSGGDSSPG